MKLSNRNTNLLSMFDANMCSRQHSRRVDWLPVRAVLNITLCHEAASWLTILPSIRYNMYASSGVSHCVLRPPHAPNTAHIYCVLFTLLSIQSWQWRQTGNIEMGDVTTAHEAYWANRPDVITLAASTA